MAVAETVALLLPKIVPGVTSKGDDVSTPEKAIIAPVALSVKASNVKT